MVGQNILKITAWPDASPKYCPKEMPNIAQNVPWKILPNNSARMHDSKLTSWGARNIPKRNYPRFCPHAWPDAMVEQNPPQKNAKNPGCTLSSIESQNWIGPKETPLNQVKGCLPVCMTGKCILSWSYLDPIRARETQLGPRDHFSKPWFSIKFPCCIFS